MIRGIALIAAPLLAGWAQGALGAVAVADSDRLWVEHSIPFAICERAADSSLQGCGHGGKPLAPADAAKVRTAVRDWNATFTGFLRFEEQEEMPRDRRGVLFSRASRDTACSTDRIGRPKTARRTNVKIGAHCNAFAAAETPVGTILHEMMHVAGFYHEQQRPDRNAFLRSHVPDGLVSKLFDIDGATQWARASRRVMTALGPYDFGSIMHYPVRNPKKAELTMGGLERLEEQGLTRSDPGRRDALSTEDIAGVQSLYANRIRAGTYAAMPAPRVP